MILENRKLVILVATHKPSVLLRDAMYQPVHCGRAVSHLDPTDMEWMRFNTIGDDTGYNISWLNPYFCELTAVYWAWKNYKNLGSPERIGLCHYRRYFMDIGLDNEITAPIHYLNKTIWEQFCEHHSSTELTKAISLLPNQEIKEDTWEYLNQNKGFFFNMFVFPKDIFFEYCNTIFNILFKLYKENSWEKLNDYQKRMAGFVAERLTGAFIYHLTQRRKLPLHETLTVIPIFNSPTKISYQMKFISALAKYVPNFPKAYSKFLSLQTHLLKS